MIFPSLPTDSIYKFCFVGGIILIVFSIIGIKNNHADFSKYSGGVDSLKMAVEGNADYIHKIIEHQHINNNSVGKILRNWEKRRIKVPKDSSTIVKAMIGDISEIKYTADSVHQLTTKHLKQVDKLIERLDSTSQENLYFFITTFLGLGLVGYGLLYWRRQQKVLDEILFYQRATIELDYKQKINPAKQDPTRYRR